MTEMSHFLAPGGWRINFRNPDNAACTKLLPKPGTTLLIGRSRIEGVCTVVWMDEGSKKLRTVEKLVCKGAYWEAIVQDEKKKSYVVTAWKGTSKDGKPTIAGDIEEGRRSKLVAKAAAALKPGTELTTQGTWGAEANPGGGKG